MIGFGDYNPAVDADEHESHLCNSLSAEYGYLLHAAAAQKAKNFKYVVVDVDHAELIGNYLIRAQLVIGYLQEQLAELKCKMEEVNHE